MVPVCMNSLVEREKRHRSSTAEPQILFFRISSGIKMVSTTINRGSRLLALEGETPSFDGLFSTNERNYLSILVSVGVKRLALGHALRWGAVQGTVPRAPSLRDRFHLR
ncbi:hypothetical protein PAPYR_4853 [Paratrimastix pyriformis]|uniref:Uncharacterized protein n=1 Tax=Paratrimastix pyriformis TaxID=342808 RepID=A0ABQ8URE4_9EUKA|nr:hypothetical protein PAPYR_4853 [Paratrimastix pyriformis]